MDGRLQHLPGEQAALLAVRGEPGAVEFEHVLGGELLDVVDRFAVHFFQQHRGRGLADHAALAGEVAVAILPSSSSCELDPHDVAAERVVFFVSMRGGRQMPTMERVLVMIEDVLLVEFFFVDGHGNATCQRCGKSP